MSDVLVPLTLDFLSWLAAEPRTYAEVMDAWRTSCPRLSAWEDAIGDELGSAEKQTNQDSLKNAGIESQICDTRRGHRTLAWPCDRG